MSSEDGLGDRMKTYEGIPRASLMPRTPVVIRIDGKAFHTLTKGLNKPVDERMQDCMWDTMLFLCKNVQGCVMGYTQSDEISLVLTDFQSQESQPWFDYDLQKVVSVSASMATVAFARSFWARFPDRGDMPAFDSRAWSIPAFEVINYLIWRQQDATRNSIQSLARAHFSHKKLHGVSCDGIQELLFLEKNINWNDCPTPQKRGACAIKVQMSVDTPNGANVIRSKWIIDKNIPIFTSDRTYVNMRLALPAPVAVSM